jgi:hypothetical protein
MQTVEEILKATGWTDEEVKALDAKKLGGFTQILSTAQQAQEKAEFEHRAQATQYDETIAPALDKWANDSARLQAEVAFYKTQAEQAKAGGFIPTAAPGTPVAAPELARNPAGQFVAGANPVPGSPQYMTREEGFRALSNTQWVLAEYMRLNNGAVPPDDIETLANEAVAQRLPLRDYAAKKYDFNAKREAIKAGEQKKHDDAIRTEEAARVNKEWAEKVGNNPNLRTAEVSRFATIDKAVKDGTRPDPLKMTREQRHEATRKQIQTEMAANETVQ